MIRSNQSRFLRWSWFSFESFLKRVRESTQSAKTKFKCFVWFVFFMASWFSFEVNSKFWGCVHRKQIIDAGFVLYSNEARINLLQWNSSSLKKVSSVEEVRRKLFLFPDSNWAFNVEFRTWSLCSMKSVYQSFIHRMCATICIFMAQFLNGF